MPDSYYHIYNRGVNKQKVFLDDQDYAVMLSLIKRYLDIIPSKNQNGAFYPNYSQDIELLTFCIMPNHFHFLVFQHRADAMKDLLKSLSVAYAMYFNKRYKRVGPIFQQRYKASRIDSEAYLLHISRYIHMNPHNYFEYEWSSMSYYLGNKTASWIRPARILELFKLNDYTKFVTDYLPSKSQLDEIKTQLAHTG